MNVNKEAGVDCGLEVSPEELKAINAMSKKKLRPEEVYAFAVRLCDNEIDRDNERFPAATLEELAPLFVGRSGLFDHQWSTRNQAARIYRTEVVRESWMTEAGEPYCYLKGCAYLLRTEGNRELIAAIEGGIKKEVSVGCAVKRAVCSICGTERGQDCGHKPGEVYDGARCFFQLEEAVDAYEFSFVAVPAQPRAGVVKGLCPAGEPAQTLRELAAGRDLCIRELDGLEREAALGRKWLSTLREEVVRMGGQRPGPDCAEADHGQAGRGGASGPEAGLSGQSPGALSPAGPAGICPEAGRGAPGGRSIFDLREKQPSKEESE